MPSTARLNVFEVLSLPLDIFPLDGSSSQSCPFQLYSAPCSVTLQLQVCSPYIMLVLHSRKEPWSRASRQKPVLPPPLPYYSPWGSCSPTALEREADASSGGEEHSQDPYFMLGALLYHGTHHTGLELDLT